MSRKKIQAIYKQETTSFSGAKQHLYWLVPFIFIVLFVNWGVEQLDEMKSLPISKVRVQGDFTHISEKTLFVAINNVANDGFFNVDVDLIRENVEKLAWVKQASVRRLWPDTLVVYVSEHVAFARWEENGLLSVEGVIFYPEVLPENALLPQFHGDATLSTRMMQEFQVMKKFSQQVGIGINSFEMDDRHSITMKMSNGLEVVLGDTGVQHRFVRFLKVYNKLLKNRIHEIDSVDLRYTNGMAIRWKKDVVRARGSRET